MHALALILCWFFAVRDDSVEELVGIAVVFDVGELVGPHRRADQKQHTEGYCTDTVLQESEQASSVSRSSKTYH